MFTSALQKFSQSVRTFVPAISCFVFILLGSVIWPIPYFGAVAPSLGLAAIYYWSIYRPDLLRPFVVFVFGLLSDALSFYPFGLSAFVFVGIYQLTFSQRRFFVNQVFAMLWSGYALVLLLSLVVGWIVQSFVAGALVPGMPILIQFCLSVALFPLPAWVLIRLQNAFLTGE